MAQEPNVSKSAAKKPPAAKPKPTAPSAEIQGKVVRSDPPATGKTQPILDKTVDIEIPKKPAKAPATDARKQGKIVRKDAAANDRPQKIDGTVEFEMPKDDTDAEEAAAAYLTQEFSDADEPADVDEPAAEAPVGAVTQGFPNETVDVEMPAQEDAPVGGATQAFTDATIDAENMPKLVDDSGSEGNRTQAFGGETIETHEPAASARRRPASARKPAGAKKEEGAAMAATILGGRYKLLKELGKGGMGAVYKAQDIKLDRIVAVKRLDKKLAEKGDYVKRFEREARVMVKLDHPNVIRCFDFGEDEKHGHYLAIEFVEGGSVEGWLKKLGRFSLGDALHLVLKTAAGLQHAHEKALIHRDVKPDNLLLTKDGIVKVADLGLAKDTDEDTSLTKTGAGAGTPVYMAPEQARDVKHVDCRVDVYALGVMLYVFLTGQPPFQGNTLVELISAKEKGKFDPMRKHNDEVPGKLDLIVDKMIAKDPKNRYASCQDVIDEIEPLGLANEQLTFLESENGAARQPAPTMMPGPKAAATRKPEAAAPKPNAKTSVGAKGPAAMTSAPVAAGNTSLGDDETVETDAWYWTLVTESGKAVTKKLSTEQVRTLIKAGHLGDKAQLSKTEKGGYRAAATFVEFQAIFKSLRTATKANIKGAKYRDLMNDIEAQDARRRKWGWLSRMFKSVSGTLFGLLWIVLILALVGSAGYFIWKYFNG